MANIPTKQAVETRVATDDQIFKRLNKRLNGLDQPLGLKPTIQNQGDAIKPDGTIAKTDDDIALIEGKPLRTPTGVLEYKEEKEDENFPVKVPLLTEAPTVESFMEAVDTTFSHFLSGYGEDPLYGTSEQITVVDGPEIQDKDIEVVTVDNTVTKDDPDEDDNPKTAEEEFGKDWEIKTEINVAGDLTGVAGRMYMCWKGIRYRFYDGEPGGKNAIKSSRIHTTDGDSVVSQDVAIHGLTNHISGRNLEVFMKDRQLTYGDIEIVPRAEISEILTIAKFLRAFDDDEIEWGKPARDGFQYNTNTVFSKLNGCEYEAGDIIKPAKDKEDPRYLPNLAQRWTEYHPDATMKPAKESQIYKPNDEEILTKKWEGTLIVAYDQGKYVKRFYVSKGRMYKVSFGFDHFATIMKKPPHRDPRTDKSWDKDNDTTQTAMNWSQLQHLGIGPNNKVTRGDFNANDKVRFAQHTNMGGWTKDLGIGEYSKGSQLGGNDNVSSIRIPHGYTVKIYQNGSFKGKKQTLRGPANADQYKIWNATSDTMDSTTVTRYSRRGFLGLGGLVGTTSVNKVSWNDQISSAKIERDAPGYGNGAGAMNKKKFERHMKDGPYFKKSHLANYNKLFDL